MNANNAKVQSILETTFQSAIERLTQESPGSLISDLYVQVDPESGEVQIYDDSENLLGKIVIFDWIDKKGEGEQFFKRVAATLKHTLSHISSKGVFESDCFIKPLSINLTDEDFTVLEELLFIDDDVYRADDPLLKNLDADLEDFLANLFSDIK